MDYGRACIIRKWSVTQWGMRAYLPLSLSELKEPKPPARQPLFVDQQQYAGEELEEKLEDGLDDAGFLSLQLAVDSDGEGGRIVAVGDLPAQTDTFSSWQQIDSFMSDGPYGQALVQQIYKTKDQAQSDALVAELFEEPLVWYDVSERLAIPEKSAP